MRPFPRGFLWGAATSSHQVEGGNEGNDWHDWEAAGRIHDGSRSGAACGWWAGKAEEDLALAAAAGHNAHRLSLEWSRLEPEEGRWDDQAFGRYEQILGAMGRLGLVPLVTVHHFTLPRWLAARGGFLAPRVVERFARYASECVRRLGSRARLWATMNEPSVLALMGYLGDAWPPGLADPARGVRALGRMLRCHGAAYRAMREAVPEVEVGIVLNAPVFEPDRAASRLDRASAWAQDWIFTGAVLRALRTGELAPPLSLGLRRVEGLARSFDFLGLNYYGRYRVRFDPREVGHAMGRHVQRPTVRTMHNDWGEVAPEGLTQQLVRLSRLGAPVYVTENGVFDELDEVRPRFLREHVGAVQRAIEQGADVRGYFHWSLLDNFEWAEGWATRFGLIAVDRATQRRTPRPSLRVYERICRANGLDDDEPLPSGG